MTAPPPRTWEIFSFFSENWLNLIIAAFAGIFASWVFTASMLVISPRFIDFPEVTTSRQQIGFGTFGVAILFIVWKWREKLKAAPLLGSEMPAAAAAQLAALKIEKVALAAKFDDGEITTKEYMDGLEAVNERVEALKMALLAAQLGKRR